MPIGRDYWPRCARQQYLLLHIQLLCPVIMLFLAILKRAQDYCFDDWVEVQRYVTPTFIANFSTARVRNP